MATSSVFDVTVGAPAALVFRTQPTSTTQNTPIVPAIAIEIQDIAGNLVTAAANTITISFDPHCVYDW